MSNIKNKSGLNQYSGTTNNLGLTNAVCFYGNLVGLSTSATTTVNATTATSATTALNATNATYATSATTALNATNATSATTALNATNATNALYATSASTAGTNVGVGNGIYTGKTGTDLQFKSISGGTNIQLIDNGNTITISGGSGGGGEIDTLYFDSNAKVVAVTDGACTCGDHDVDGTFNILNGPAGNTHFGHLGTNNYISHSCTGNTFFRTHSTGASYDTYGCLSCLGNFHLTDSNCVVLGTGADMKIYHDGLNSYICNLTSDLRIDAANNWSIRNDGETAIFGLKNSCVSLYYNGVAKFKTHIGGTCITGCAIASQCFQTGGRFFNNIGVGYKFYSAFGCGCAVQWTNSSDRRKKECIKPYECGLEKVNQLNPVYYQWIHDGTEDVGFIAQDVLEVEPKLVMGSEEECYGLNYGKFTAITVKAIQELSCEVKELKEEINILKNK